RKREAEDHARQLRQWRGLSWTSTCAAVLFTVLMIAAILWADSKRKQATVSDDNARAALVQATAETKRANTAAQLAEANEEKARAQARIAISRQLAALS